MRSQRLLVLFAGLLLMLPVGLLAQNTPTSQDNQNTPQNSPNNGQGDMSNYGRQNNAPNGQSNMGNNGQQTMENNGEPQQLIDPALIYNDKNPGSWVGKTVTLKNVMVQDTNKGGNFWVGQNGHHRILVVKPEDNPNAKALQVHKGDIVTVTGTVQPASKYEAKETGTRKGSMQDAESSSGVFLQASNLSISSSTHQ
ncbi:MAG TPA: hypothetical protein VGS27_24165 [Candidatus Sulfotelmatobacter sp.]|nr:hypothetical protein [Candidatus Sulfotelmatobacter sp.]